MASRDYLDFQRQRAEEAIARFLDKADLSPAPLADAVRHAVIPGGKRIRPVITLAASEAVATNDGDPDAALAAAVAIELLHSYTLVHDDLPAMDNSPMRRGLPSVHAKFGEANAVLAGDALQALAFSAIAAPSSLPPARAIRLTQVLSRAAVGVVRGQTEDLSASPLDEPRLGFILAHKTGDLFSAAAELGAIAGGAPDDEVASLATFGAELGMAFQIIDDIFDVPSDPNAAPEPSSCLRIWTPDKARSMAAFHTREAVAHLMDIPGTPASAALSDLAESLLARIE